MVEAEAEAVVIMVVEGDSVIGVHSQPLVIQMVVEEADISIIVSQMLHLVLLQIPTQKQHQRKQRQSISQG